MADTSVDANFSALLQPSNPNLNDSDLIPRGGFAVSPNNSYDITTIKSENRILKTKLRQLESDLNLEQDSVSSLRRKLNSTERERLEAVSKANEQVNRFDGEVAKLRSQLEKGEAIRQNLEYELTKAKRDISHEKRSVSERDALISEVNETMKQKIQDLTSQVESLCDELDNTKLKANEDIRKLKRESDDRDTEIERMRADINSVENEKTKLEYALQQSQDHCKDQECKIQEVEGEKRLQSDELRRQITEFEMLKEQSELRKSDLQDAANRVKTLEEAIEAERAAHLESKFNSEIVQLRMRDLESALDLEKNTKLEALNSSEKLTNQLKDLQHIYDEERKLSLETKEKLENAEKEYASLSKQLSHELEEKRSVIKEYSKQLEAHQREFNDLKRELNKAKKRQVHIEDTYTGCVRELEVLNDNFKADDILNNAKKSSKKTKKDADVKSSHTKQPTVLLESLRHTLITFQRKLDEANSDLTRVKEQKEQLEKEAKKYKDMVWSKDKALHTSQSGVAEASKELKRAHEDNHNLEKLIKQLRNDLDHVHRQLQQEKTKYHEMADQCSQLVTKSKASERSMSDFMIHLYQQLAIDVPVAERCDVRQKSFDDLSLLITENVTKMVNNLRWMNEKIKHLEVSLQNKEELVQQMQNAHEEQLEKLAGVAEGRSQQWTQQKAEMERHYKQLLGEIHDRHSKTQTLADQAWEKVRMTGSLQQGLERECDELRKQLMRMQDEHHCLLATCALLSGALYPMYQRNNALATQRDILTEQFYQFQYFKREVQKLIDALSLDKLNAKNVDLQPLMQRKLSPLIRFRTAGVAIIAANRLKNMRGECKMFVTTQDGVPGQISTLVCTGGIEDVKPARYSGLADTAHLLDNQLGLGEAHSIEWLCSGNLLSTVLATMGDLVFTLHKARRGEQGYDQKKVVQTARNSFQKFVCHLPSTFPTMQSDAAAGLRERNSLFRFLGYGLNRALAHGSLDGGSSQSALESSNNMISSLQQHMLEFTKRLHMAEVERRDLRVEVNKLNKARQAQIESNDEAERMAQELDILREQTGEAVERERFDQLCSELSRALHREQEAQQLLKEQNKQMQQLGMQLDRSKHKGSEKEQTLTEAVQGLAEAKMELKRQEQRVRQLTRQIQQQDGERKPLEVKVKDAENALRTASKDRENLTNYIRNVEAALKQVQAQISMTGGQDFSRLLAPDLLPANLSKIGPELTACQSLVGSFVEAERILRKRVVGLVEELDQHKQHTAMLKRELSNACKREYEDELEKLKLTNGQSEPPAEPFTPSRSMMGGRGSPSQPRFSALQQDTSIMSPPTKSRTPQQSKLQAPKTYTSSLTKIPAANKMRRKPAVGGERK